MSDQARYETLRKLFLKGRELRGDERRKFVRDQLEIDPELGKELSELLNYDRREPIIRNEDDKGLKLRPKRFRIQVPSDRKKQGFIGLLVLILLAISGWWTFRELEKRSFETIETGLRTIHEADIAALEQWIRAEKRMALQLIQHPHIKPELEQLLEDQPDTNLPQFKNFRNELRPLMVQEGLVSVVVTDPVGRIVFCIPEDFTGEMISSGAMQIMGRLRDEEVLFFPPHYDRTARTERISDRFGPLTWIDAVIRDSAGEMIGSFNIAHLEKEYFSPLIGVAQFGKRGETFAFDRDGFLLSESRFQDELSEMGTLPKDGRSVLNLRITEPGSSALTKIVRQSVESIGDPNIRSGFIKDPYINYTGQATIGCWSWLDAYGFGLATEVDYDEATHGMRGLAIGFWVIYLILAASLIGWLSSGNEVRQLRKTVLEQEQLGAYVIEKKIGEGGLGEVYLAHHSLLKRPTALKVLKAEGLPPGALERFEKEVMAASRLRHPNTIEIYDYGHAEDGTFYYAMEFLNGLDLQQWVASMGPFPPSRTIHVLTEICRSLQESHQIGLIHRDIKPGNIFLCEMGGIFDQVKVLDFGLVKDLESQGEEHTRILEISGSPHFMAPERIRDPLHADARVDIYAIGGIGFFLLSGKRPLDSDREMSMIDRILELPIPDIGSVSRQEIPQGLASLIDRCLRKDPEERPADVQEIISELTELKRHFPWPPDDSEFLWENSRHLI